MAGAENLGMQLSRVLHRNGTQKTVLTYDVQTRRSRNYINDTEIQVQRRQTAAWRLGLQHRHCAGHTGCRRQLATGNPLVWCTTGTGRNVR